MWSVAISEVAKIFSKFFEYKEESTERQSETVVIQKNRKTHKAIDVAEKIIFIADAHITESTTDEKTLREYKRLRRKFFKYN